MTMFYGWETELQREHPQLLRSLWQKSETMPWRVCCAQAHHLSPGTAAR